MDLTAFWQPNHQNRTFAWNTNSPNFAPKSGDFGLHKAKVLQKTFAIVRLTINKVKPHSMLIENLLPGVQSSCQFAFSRRPVSKRIGLHEGIRNLIAIAS
jgi:hypothetical protein